VTTNADGDYIIVVRWDDDLSGSTGTDCEALDPDDDQDADDLECYVLNLGCLDSLGGLPMTATPAKCTVPSPCANTALTMMELLVTVAILSLLIAGLSQLVVTNSQNASATGALARIADTGRTAMQFSLPMPAGRGTWVATTKDWAGGRRYRIRHTRRVRQCEPPVLRIPPLGRACWISLFLGLTTRPLATPVLQMLTPKDNTCVVMCSLRYAIPPLRPLMLRIWSQTNPIFA
jgi:hypothetical protein